MIEGRIVEVVRSGGGEGIRKMNMKITKSKLGKAREKGDMSEIFDEDW